MLLSLTLQLVLVLLLPLQIFLDLFLIYFKLFEQFVFFLLQESVSLNWREMIVVMVVLLSVDTAATRRATLVSAQLTRQHRGTACIVAVDVLLKQVHLGFDILQTTS